MDTMKDPLKKILIVKEGEWGDLHSEKGDYDSLFELLKKTIERSTRVFDSFSGKFEQRQVAEVEFVETSKEAMSRVFEAPLNVQVHAVIFKSRSMIDVARKFKKRCCETNRKTKVILFSGLLPEEEVILIEHSWGLDSESIQRIIVQD